MSPGCANASSGSIGERKQRMTMYNAVKVFSATKAKEREDIGNQITAWLQDNPQVEIMNTEVRQSSDSEFHCLTIILFYRFERQ